MKKSTGLMVAASICLLTAPPFSLPGASSQGADNFLWGQPIDGVQMSLSPTGLNGSGLQVALRNVSDRDVTLNLGAMMANGKVQQPNSIALSFTDAQGRKRLFKYYDKRDAGVAGRLDDYVVPLRAGSMYSLQFTLDQFWCQETTEFAIELLPGTNHLTAQFEGTGAKLVSLDMPAVKFMNFWLGKVESNTLTIER